MTSILVENAESTASPVVTDDFFKSDLGGVDVVFRFQGSAHLKTVKVSATNTRTIRDGVSAFMKHHRDDLDLLKSVIYWQKKTIDFQALHAAFLLGSMSEEAFEEESDKFVTTQVDVDPVQVASVVERLDSLIGIPFDTSDYASFFQCSQENVMAGLRRLTHHPHFVAMLPSAREE